MASLQPCLPALDLLIDGAPLPARLARAFTSLRVHRQLGRPGVAELGFTGADPCEALNLFTPGRPMRIAVRGEPAGLFQGCISAVEVGYGSGGVATLAVRAYDALVALCNRGRARAFIDLDAAELARELVADLGLSVHCDAPGPLWPRLLQTGTDFEVLAEVASRSGLYPLLEGRTLQLVSLEGGGEPLGLTLGDGVTEVHFEANAHRAVRRVEAAGWDPWRGGDHQAAADGSRAGTGSADEWSAQALGGSGDLYLPGRPLQGDDQARAAAQAALDASRAQALVLRAVAAGDTRLRPGMQVTIAGVAPRLAGPHLLTSVHHTLDAELGFRSEITSGAPATTAPAEGVRMALGLVTRIDDPQRWGRVQVALPAFGDLESDWLQVLAAGAGKGKGLVMQPDVGDRVLVLLDRADPAQAVVLGSLYADGGLPEEQGGLGKDASFCLLTPGGHRLRFDDGSRTLHVAAANGSQLEMAPGRVRLHATAPLTIEAPGQPMVLRADRIDFERG
jgi:phage baseplate assembly protein gpV/phage protein D